MDFSKVSLAIADQHPQWCFIGPDGQRQVYNGLVSVCPTADYYQHKVFEVIDEVLERYDIDGFFFNWFGFNEVDYSGRYRGVSQSAASKAGFAEFSGGLELPTGRNPRTTTSGGVTPRASSGISPIASTPTSATVARTWV